MTNHLKFNQNDIKISLDKVKITRSHIMEAIRNSLSVNQQKDFVVDLVSCIFGYDEAFAVKKILYPETRKY